MASWLAHRYWRDRNNAADVARGIAVIRAEPRHR